MALSKQSQKELAALINRLQVCQHMLDTVPPNQRKIWRDAECETTIYLYEHYGIALPGLTYWQEVRAAETRAKQAELA